MINDFWLSAENCKQLKDWGCEIDSYKKRVKCSEDGVWRLTKNYQYDSYSDILHPTYHLLTDICCNHADEFFKEDKGRVSPFWGHPSIKILMYLQAGEKQQAEFYFMQKTVFNPKNNAR